MYKLFQATVVDLNKLKRTIKFLCLTVFVLVIEGIQHKLSIDELGWAGQDLGWVQKEVLAAGGTGRTRWVSIFDGPGVFCIAYTTALPYIMQYLFMPAKKIVKIMSGILTLLFLLAIYYTGSRGGFLATIAIISLFLMYKSKVSIPKLAVLSALLVVLFMLAPSHLTSTRDSSNSAQNRVDMWGMGADTARYHQVIGVGRGNYSSFSMGMQAHNSFIEIMAETGFPGVFFWVCLIYLAFKGLYVFYEKEEKSENKMLAMTTGIALVGYLVSSTFVTAEFETFYMVIAFAAIIGGAAKEKISFSMKEKLIIMSCVFGVFIFIKLFVTLYFS